MTHPFGAEYAALEQIYWIKEGLRCKQQQDDFERRLAKEKAIKKWQKAHSKKDWELVESYLKVKGVEV
jgi:hypothetical protein